MLSWILKIASGCFSPVRRYLNKDEEKDPLLWSRDIGQHSAGKFSMAVVQANESMEDHSQVEIGNRAIFVGVYDGHGGPDASQYVLDNLFLHLIRLAMVHGGTFSEAIIRNAFLATEAGFISLVQRTRHLKPMITVTGSCCLVGLIWEGRLYVANLGDSRAVLGCLGRSNAIVSVQLTQDHNAGMEEVRRELRSRHPDDSEIVLVKNGAWRIKGIIQVSRSIGDAYLKRPDLTVDPSLPRFRLREPLRRPVLSAEPAIYTRALGPRDKFIIFASDGLWEQLSNQEAVNIVHRNPRTGIAKRLIRSALDVAARKQKLQYGDIKRFGHGVRRMLHDDISVIVVFIEHDYLLVPNLSAPVVSVRGFIDLSGMSAFSNFDGLNAVSSSSPAS